MTFNRPEKRESKALADIRNIAIIFAASAVAYGALFGPLNGSTNDQKPSDMQVAQSTEMSVAKKVEKATEDKALETKMVISAGRLIPGTDEPSTIFKNHLKERISELESTGNVEPVSLKVAQQGAQKANQTPAPVYTPVAPVASTAAPDATGQTLHPAPFVDEKAAASIAIKKAALMESGAMGTVKIGYHVDGSPMSENEKKEQIRQTLANIPDEWTISYTAPNEKVRLYVFTDTTCPYCRKFHENMDQILGAGISVHYLLYPRDLANAQTGELTPTAKNMKNVWCSVNQRQAFDDAFAGYRIPEADCSALPEDINRMPAPVPDHFLAGDMFNVEYTPTFFASNGESGYGFRDLETLINTVLR